MEQRTAEGGRRGFEIADSREPTADSRLPVPPDAALCSACEGELLDPRNRRVSILVRNPLIQRTSAASVQPDIPRQQTVPAPAAAH